ncbi:MAG: hypothetical protein ABIG95_05190 [Candidatus Woesearchaeota archaeon]
MDITGWATQVSNLDAFKPWLPVMGFFLVLIILWVGMLLLIQLVLFIISCVKHDLSFSNAVDKSVAGFKKYYIKFFHYYVPIIVITLVLSFIAIMLPFSGTFMKIGMLALSFVLAVIQGTYFFVVDTSLAKSYYLSLKGKKFVFMWMSGYQFVKLFAVGLILLALFIPSLLLLGIPFLFIGYIMPFVRYPIIVEDLGVIESIQKAFGLLRKRFWDMVFFTSMYGFLLFAVYLGLGMVFGLFELIPYVGAIFQGVRSIITMVVVQPFGTILFTEMFYAVEKSIR